MVVCMCVGEHMFQGNSLSVDVIVKLMDCAIIFSDDFYWSLVMTHFKPHKKTSTLSTKRSQFTNVDGQCKHNSCNTAYYNNIYILAYWWALAGNLVLQSSVLLALVYRTDWAEHVTKVGEHVTKVGEHVTKVGEHVTKVCEHVTKVGEHVAKVGEHVTKVCEHVTKVGEHVTNW